MIGKVFSKNSFVKVSKIPISSLFILLPTFSKVTTTFEATCAFKPGVGVIVGASLGEGEGAGDSVGEEDGFDVLGALVGAFVGEVEIVGCGVGASEGEGEGAGDSVGASVSP